MIEACSNFWKASISSFSDEGERAPLYQPPPKKEPDREVSEPVKSGNVTKKRRTQDSSPDTASIKTPVRIGSASSSRDSIYLILYICGILDMISCLYSVNDKCDPAKIVLICKNCGFQIFI